MINRQVHAAQSKLNVTSRKTVHYCIPAAQLDVSEVTRPSFSRRLKGVAYETNPVQGCGAMQTMMPCAIDLTQEGWSQILYNWSAFVTPTQNRSTH